MRNFMLSLVILLLCATVAIAKPLNLNQISEAVCRVHAGEGYGTGTCIAQTEDSYFVLTNGHVVGNARQVTVEFFKGGYKTKPLPAAIYWKAYQQGRDVDFAILTVSKHLFGDYPPRVIPLAPEGYRPTRGYYIAAVGCPSAKWAQGWEGRIVDDKQSRVMFVPAPVGGQSGSAVTVLVKGYDGQYHTRVGAVLTWRIEPPGQTPYGGAIPVQSLYNVLSGQHTSYDFPAYYKEMSTLVDINEAARRRVYGGSSGSFGSGGSWGCPPRPAPNQPQPQPIPPYSQGPGNGGNSPYGTSPDIGAPWPGAEQGPPKVEEPEPIQPSDKTQQELESLAEKYQALLDEKKELEDKLIATDDKLKAEKQAEEEAAKAKAEAEAAAQETVEETESKGWFANLRARLGEFWQGALLAFGLGVLIWVWNKFLKQRVVKRIDSVQDYLEAEIAKKWGKDLAKEAREVMEGVEEALLGFADDFIEDIESRKRVAKAKVRGNAATQLKAQQPKTPKNINLAELLEAVREAAEDADNTNDVPPRVEQILRDVAEGKKKAGPPKTPVDKPAK